DRPLKWENAVDRAVKEYLPVGGRVLDLGCGTGANLARIKRLRIPFSKYVGVDLTPQMLAQAQHSFGDLPNVIFLRQDLLSDSLPDGEFELIISTWVFSHLRGRSAELEEKAVKRLKPNGHMIVLMLTQSGTWLDLPIGILARPFLIEPVSQDTYVNSPSLAALRRFWGGMVTLAIWGKEE
ncbi:MAG: class I SAM-dependent methyltransferase, partial [Chloroflexi bacterium]|nr:class I SAM-dependent methyltransferase [Chloroflexota bacterium]